MPVPGLEVEVVSYGDFWKVLLRFAVLAVAVKGTETISPRAADLLVLIILLGVALQSREGMQRFGQFLRREVGG